jgi:two-component system, NtrC family, sensor histidine kinase KinB
MRLSLRWHVFLTLVPLLLLLIVLGSAGAALLQRLGGRIDAILRENYRSVIYMERLNEAIERVDSSFHIALAGREEDARKQYEEHWALFQENLEGEKQNITLPGEGDLVQQLAQLGEEFRRQGDAFYHQTNNAARNQVYFQDSRGLFDLFHKIKAVSNQILRINQENMEQANKDAQRAAFTSLLGFAGGFALAVTLAGLLAWGTIRSVVQPIRAVTESALAISAGNLDQVVPVASNDELGQVAQAFNRMARHLRDLRQSQLTKLLRAQQTSQATIDSFPDAVLVLDLEGHVEMANPAARRLLGVVPPEAGQQIGRLWSPPEALNVPLNNALRGQQDYLPEVFDKTILMGPNGAERALLPRILTIRDPYGTALGAAVLLQDVTRLRLLDQVKGNLVATASHELKTPLTSIRLAIYMLLEEATGPLTAKQTEMLLDARENCERLLAMVNNLLDIARLEEGSRQLEKTPQSPELLLRCAADAVRPRADEKRVDIVISVPSGLPEVAADPTRIGTAFRNLLDNALTYTDAGGRITLSAAALADAVEFTIADTGVGIPPEYLSRVFEKFFRTPIQSAGGGTGLGLAIVQEIVIAHGGRISCHSQPNTGTSFRLTLPIARPGSSPPHDSLHPEFRQ